MNKNKQLIVVVMTFTYLFNLTINQGANMLKDYYNYYRFLVNLFGYRTVKSCF